MTRDEDTAYACCSIGIGRWYWVVWTNETDARAGADPLASGYEKTREASEKKAVEAAGPQSKRLPAKWASGFKRRGAVRTEEAGKRDKPKSRLSRPADARASRPNRPTFLYVASECDRPGSRGEVVVVKHRIVRQTARKIHVDREPFREEEWHSQAGDEPATEAPKPRMLAVDREVLRREGRFLHRGSYFYASEADGVRDVHKGLTDRHAWCAALGVSFPCSAGSIKAAYRRLARESHPDAGGDPAEFRAIEQAYREALAYFSFPDDDASKPGQV